MQTLCVLNLVSYYSCWQRQHVQGVPNGSWTSAPPDPEKGWVDVAQLCQGALISINCVAHLGATQLINNYNPIMSYIWLWKGNISLYNLCTIKLDLCLLDFNNYWNKSVLGHRAENHAQCLLYLFTISLFFRKCLKNGDTENKQINGLLLLYSMCFTALQLKVENISVFFELWNKHASTMLV